MEDWKNDKELIKLLRYLYHHDINLFNIILAKIPSNFHDEILEYVKE